MGAVNIVGGVVIAASGWFGRAAIGKAMVSVATRIGANSAAASTASAASTGAAGGAATATAAGSIAVLPVVVGVATAASFAYGSWQFYNWWRTPQFPLGIQVLVIRGEHAGHQGVVVGIANGDVVLASDRDPAVLITVCPEDIEVLDNYEYEEYEEYDTDEYEEYEEYEEYVDDTDEYENNRIQ